MARTTNDWDRERSEPLDGSYFTPREEVARIFADAPPIDPEQFWNDLDAYVDPTPREWFDSE